ncbi:MAG: DoxX family protein [Rhodobiaceae bacterium]|nr:DoxX family protein [Rhodobiaceae bacterium]
MSTTNSDYAAFILRVSSGALFLAHGLLKVFIFTIPGTVGYFESLGLPAIFAYLTILAEVGGGVALILGVAVRIVALAQIPVLLGALWVHSNNGWLFSGEGGGWEFPLFWSIVQVAIAILGAGAYALRVPVLHRSLGKFA